MPLPPGPRLPARAARRLVGVGAAGIGVCWLAVAAITRLGSRPGIPLDSSARSLLQPLSAVPPVEAVSRFLAVIGEEPVSVVVAAVLAVLIAVRRGPVWGLVFALTSAASAGEVILMKWVAHRPGPALAFYHGMGSFPSGHTANAAVIAAVAGLLVPRPAMWVAGGAYVVLVALSRVVVAAHWFTDTIVGGVEGASAALLIAAAWSLVATRSRTGA